LLLIGGGGLAALWAISSERDPETALAGPAVRDAAERPPASAAPLAGAAPSTERGRSRVGPELTIWVSGRVARPAGTPVDEAIEVVALPLKRLLSRAVPNRPRPVSDELAEREHKHPETILSRATVESDGSFRIGFPEDAPDEVRLALKARYLYLDTGTPVRPRAVGPIENIELEPKLGSRLIIRSTIEEGGELRVLAGTEVLVQGYHRRADDDWDFSIRQLDLGTDGTLTCAALAPDREYILRAVPVGHTPGDLRGVKLVPGETTERNLVFSVGARISGRVLAKDDTPISSATIQAVSRRRDDNQYLGKREVTSAEDGTFTVAGLPESRVELVATHPRYVQGESEQFVSAGESVTDVLVVLDLGQTITGNVQWSDGSAAAELEVRAVSGDAQVRRSTLTVDDGAFELAGLTSGNYAVYAEGTRSVEGTPTIYKVLVKDVAAGTRGLALRLELPPGLAGHVVDDRGVPVRKFVAFARPLEDPALVVAENGGRLLQSFTSPDGSFAFPQATPGTWMVGASSEDHVELEGEKHIAIPGDNEPLVVVLHRGASVSGIVSDAAGEPVAGAEVHGGFLEPGFFEGFEKERTTESDDQGRFLLTPLAPGSVTILAQAEGWAASEPLTADLETGGQADNVQIVLLRGGTLTGEVHEDGEPGKDRGVQLFSSELGPLQRTKTAEDGTFTIEHISPGSYNVIADGRGKEPLFAAAEIRDGETTHVALGDAAREIRVHGHITRGGAPMGDGDLIVLGEGGTLFESLAQSDIENDGSYAVMLKQPGAHTFFFERVRLEHRVMIPDVDDHKLDIELPVGTITGRVRDASGPLDRFRVDVFPEDGASILSYVDGGMRTNTDNDGRYEFDGLAPGIYSVSAGSNSAGRTVRTGLVLGWGATLSGVDFELETPGRIEGVVTTHDGHPAGHAAIFVRDASGAPLQAFAKHSTDRAGRFQIEGVTAGRVTLLARTGDAAAAEVTVTVVAGESSDVELVVHPGILLRVSLRDADGEPTTAGFSVTDARGREYAFLTSDWDMKRLMNEGYSPSTRCVGPLPPGVYRVEASSDDRSASSEVTLEEPGEHGLELVLE
jgi:hypothetical protein